MHTESLTLNVKQRLYKLGAFTAEFKDGEFHMILLPSLNLSAYGDTEEEAEHMMTGIIIPEFFKHQLTGTSHVDKDGILKDFNLSEETVITMNELVTA